MRTCANLGTGAKGLPDPPKSLMLDLWRKFATFSSTNPFSKLTMELTKSFPPADAFVEMMMGIDYKKHLNTFMDGVEIFCAFVAAVAIILAEKWQEHNMTERTQLFVLQVIEGAKTFYAWVKNVFVPEFKALIEDCQVAYNNVCQMF